jgi:hypothetical protein
MNQTKSNKAISPHFQHFSTINFHQLPALPFQAADHSNSPPGIQK